MNNEVHYFLYQIVEVDLLPQLLTGPKLIMNQIMAVLLKKFAFTRRSPILLVVMMVMPVIFVLIAILAVNNLRNKHDLPSLALEFDGYGKTIAMVETEDGNVIEKYIELLKSSDTKNDFKVIAAGMEEYILRIVSRTF